MISVPLPMGVVHLAFYEAAAQILPIFLLTVFLGEGRIARGDAESQQGWGSFALVALVVMGVMLLGELAALGTLARGHDTYFFRGLTTLALIYGFFAIVAQGAKLLLLTRPEPLSATRMEGLQRLYALVLVLALLASLEILDPGFLPV